MLKTLMYIGALAFIGGWGAALQSQDKHVKRGAIAAIIGALIFFFTSCSMNSTRQEEVRSAAYSGGHDSGYESGYEEGYERGYDDGWSEGYEEAEKGD